MIENLGINQRDLKKKKSYFVIVVGERECGYWRSECGVNVMIY